MLDSEPNPTGDRAALARLRRAGSLAEAMADEATLQLFLGLGLGADDRARLPRVAVVAVVLAQVRDDDGVGEDGRRPAAIRAVGRASFSDADSARMKPQRFKALLAARTDEELLVGMRRLVALADRRINVGDLAASILLWGDQVRARWAFEYHNAGAAAPAA
jgi:CRISPR system Cascade subunit CasB